MTKWTLCLRFFLIGVIACSRDAGVANLEPAYLGDSECATCTIAITELGVVGNDSLMPTVDARLASDGDSLIAVTPLQGRSAIGFFSFSGAARGVIDLPAGWRAVSGIEFHDDGELVIMSEQRNRVLHLSREGKMGWQVDVPPNTHQFAIVPELVVNAELRTSEALGLPLHVISHEGKVLRSFGARDETVIPRTENLWRRRLASSNSGSLWSANPDKYTIEKWYPGGRLMRRMERKSAWWDSVSSGANSSRFATERPKAELISMWEDRSGLLWMQLKVASREWKALSPHEIARRHDLPFHLAEYDEFFETVIEVIDPAKGTLLATTRFPGAVGLLLRGNIFAKWMQTGAQSYGLRLVQLSLRGRPLP